MWFQNRRAKWRKKEKLTTAQTATSPVAHNSDIALAFTVPVSTIPASSSLSVSPTAAGITTETTPTTFPTQNTDLKSQFTVVTVPSTAVAQGGVAAAAAAAGVQVIGQGGVGWPSFLSPVTYIPASLPGGATTILTPQILSTANTARMPILTTPVLGLNPGAPQLFTLGQTAAGGTASSAVPMIQVAIPQVANSTGTQDEAS